MHKVVTINLNGKAYQLEEAAFTSLRAYLDQVDKSLTDNPDKSEIMADFEQAIADKCQAYLSDHKNVITGVEVDKIILEMGPVNGGDKSEAKVDGEADANKDEPPSRRLYQIKEEAMISGLCAGIGAYFKIDPTWVRIIWVILTILTSGAWIAVHVVLMLVVPVAKTPEEKAQAYGENFSASDFLDKARAKYADIADKKPWQKFTSDRMPERRHLVENWKVFTRVAAGILTFALSLAIAVWVIVWALSLITILTNGTFLGDEVFIQASILAQVLFVTCVFIIVLLPIRGLGVDFGNYANNQVDRRSDIGQVGGIILWLAAVVFALILAYQNVPEFRIWANDAVKEVDALTLFQE